MSAEGGERSMLAQLAAPYGREIRLEDVRFESGMRLMKITIREGKRITIIDIDAATARQWADTMSAWARDVEEGTEGA